MRGPAALSRRDERFAAVFICAATSLRADYVRGAVMSIAEAKCLRDCRNNIVCGPKSRQRKRLMPGKHHGIALFNGPGTIINALILGAFWR
jgi:hypothetical protein